MTLGFDDAASEHFDDYLGKKCQESTKTNKQKNTHQKLH